MLAVFYSLWLTLSPVRVAMTAALWVISCLLVCRACDLELRLSRKEIPLLLAVLLFSSVRFYEYWLQSSAVKRLAAKLLSFDAGLFLVLAALLASVFSFTGVLVLLCSLRKTKPYTALRLWFGARPIQKDLILAAALTVALFLQLQRSSLDYLPSVLRIRFPYLLANLLVLFSFLLLLVFLVRKVSLGAVILCTLISVFSIANFYVILLHGSPLYPSEFANTRTAFNVLSGYKFPLSPQLFDILALYFLELRLAGLCVPIKRSGAVLRAWAAGLLCCGAGIYTLLFSPVALKNLWQFSWNASVMYSGFLCSAANDVKASLHPVHCPEGYDASVIRAAAADRADASAEYPDIILILNESFCDLNIYSEVPTNRDYLESFYSIENACYGIAFSPNIGGGTNDSEFELLTSDSMKLMAASAPFTYIAFSEKNATLLTYLKSLGYTTTVMHNSTPYNYSRHIAFPAMGFDHVYLGADSFSETNYYGERPVLDRDDYAGMLSLYERDGGEPRFYYLLTYQNHGGWEQNDAAFDTVRTTKDFGNLTDDLDEYLSSAALSADAFRELTEYFKNSDRPVVVCMVGDHAPSFISQLDANREMSFEETELWKRAVPFVIWCNFDFERPDGPLYCSMTDLVPMILSCTDMPLTPYYRQILTVMETLPVRTRFGIVMDAEGHVYAYDDTLAPDEQLTMYFYMEYNEITAADDYRAELIQIAK